MANPIGKLTIDVTLHAEETITPAVTSSKSVAIAIASPLLPSATSQFFTETIDYQDTGTIADGYLNGSPFYAEVTNASTPVATISGTSDVEFLYVKHTGYEYDSSSAKSTTQNQTDHLLVRGGATDGFIIACLPPGGAIALPVQSPLSGWGAGDEVNSADYFFKSVDPDDLSVGENSISMLFVCLTYDSS